MKKTWFLFAAALVILTLCGTCFAESATRIGVSMHSITIPDGYNMEEVFDEYDGLIKSGANDGVEIRFTMTEEDEFSDTAELLKNVYADEGKLVSVNGIDCIVLEMESSMYQDGATLVYAFVDGCHDYYVEFQDTTATRDIEAVRAIAEPIMNTIK